MRIWLIFFFKQKTAYEIGTGDWSSDVCSSDLPLNGTVLKKIDEAALSHNYHELRQGVKLLG